VIEIVEGAVRECGFETGYSLKSLDTEKDKLEQEINNELLYSSDVYDTVKLDGNTQYFEVQRTIQERYSNPEKIKLFIPKKMMKTKDIFHPVDNSGNEMKWLKCTFKKQGSCDIEYNSEGRNNNYYLNRSNYWKNLESYSPKIFFYKGDKKEDINERLVEALKQETKSLSEKIEKLIQDTESKKEKFLEELDTPFIPKEKIAIAIESVEKQMDELQLRYKDTQRLSDLVG
jgi:MoxR-like ATPase